MSSDLPPQAYTRETLQKAFDWLQDQPEPVKASVHTPDTLVSLYLRSQKLSDHNAPVSSKKFISDLKNLATSLDQFNGHQPPPVPHTHIPMAQPPQEAPIVAQPQVEIPPVTQPIQSSDPIPEVSFNFGSELGQSTTVTETKTASFELTSQTTTTSSLDLLDPVTLDRVKKTRERFNLSSDAEALRLLVSLGYEKFSTFP